MTKTPTITLNDGRAIPAIGFGTFQIPDDGSTYQAVKEALAIGYRHIDTILTKTKLVKLLRIVGFHGTKSG